jgi:uncharacterized protein YbjQ (UPF0145 family)
MEPYIIWCIPIALLALGLFAGGTTERRHLRSLEKRETAMRDMTVTQIKSFPGYLPGSPTPQMIVAEAVIATDYLKSFLANLRNIFGGQIDSYQTMLIRARREATLRILEQARQQGYNSICNLRLDTADVGGNSVTAGKQGMVMAAILASATAYNAQNDGIVQ